VLSAAPEFQPSAISLFIAATPKPFSINPQLRFAAMEGRLGTPPRLLDLINHQLHHLLNPRLETFTNWTPEEKPRIPANLKTWSTSPRTGFIG
jgi:hypothetical protein